MRAVLCRRDRAPESAPRTVLPDAVVGGLRRAELGTGHRVASGGFDECAGFSGLGSGGDAPESLHLVAPQFGTGGLRRIFVRGHANGRKRLLIPVCGFNLGLLLRHLTGVGTPRSLPGRGRARLFTLLGAANRSLDRLGSGRGAFLGVDPARFAVLGSSDPSINHLDINSQKEH